jgi:hypothetical protein
MKILDSTSPARCASLFSDFTPKKYSNKVAYDANMTFWKTALIDAAKQREMPFVMEMEGWRQICTHPTYGTPAALDTILACFLENLMGVE